MKIIVVSAHPDDLELSCAGYLFKMQEQGADITSIVTVAPSAEVNNYRSKEIVQQEMEHSYQLSKFKLKVFDTALHENGRPNLTVDNVSMTRLDALLEACDLAIIHNPNDYHQDHRATYNLSYPILIKKAREIWTMQSVPYCYHYRTNTADIVADISQQWHKKEQLLKCYSSYINSQMIQKVSTSNQYWAGKINAQYAEQFTSIYRNV